MILAGCRLVSACLVGVQRGARDCATLTAPFPVVATRARTLAPPSQLPGGLCLSAIAISAYAARALAQPAGPLEGTGDALVRRGNVASCLSQVRDVSRSSYSAVRLAIIIIDGHADAVADHAQPICQPTTPPTDSQSLTLMLMLNPY